jgi:hypothetical protein
VRGTRGKSLVHTGATAKNTSKKLIESDYKVKERAKKAY